MANTCELRNEGGEVGGGCWKGSTRVVVNDGVVEVVNRYNNGVRVW